MADSKAIKTEVTPAGIARFPCLNEPDPGQEDWANYVPKYKVDLVFEEAPAKLVRHIEDAIATARKEAEDKSKAGKTRAKPTPANEPYFPETDKEGDETGNVCFRFGAKSEFKDKSGKVKPIHIGLFDTKKQPTTDEIGMGSTIKVAYKAVPWVNPRLEYGCTLRIIAVQVIELVAPGGGGADASMFDEEDGFEAETKAKPEDVFDAADDDDGTPPWKESAAAADDADGDF